MVAIRTVDLPRGQQGGEAAAHVELLLVLLLALLVLRPAQRLAAQHLRVCAATPKLSKHVTSELQTVQRGVYR